MANEGKTPEESTAEELAVAWMTHGSPGGDPPEDDDLDDDEDVVCTANSIEQANYALGLDPKRRAAVEWDLIVEELRDDLVTLRDAAAPFATCDGSCATCAQAGEPCAGRTLRLLLDRLRQSK